MLAMAMADSGTSVVPAPSTPAAPLHVPAWVTTATVTPDSRPVSTQRVISASMAAACAAGRAAVGRAGNGAPVDGDAETLGAASVVVGAGALQATVRAQRATSPSPRSAAMAASVGLPPGLPQGAPGRRYSRRRTGAMPRAGAPPCEDG